MLTLASTRTMDASLPPRALSVGGVPPVDWRTTVPTLSSQSVSVRELRLSDARSLHAMLTTEEVARFISPPPTTVEGFERFIRWTFRQHAGGRYVCFGIVPAGRTEAVGIIQVRALDPEFGVGEWGFAIGREFWGTGVFVKAARLVLNFVFTEMPTERLEARAVTENGRGNGVLKKLGAVREALLRHSFARDAVPMDQQLWSILRGHWIVAKATWGAPVH
jgi:[ribosomal protein S5]-alanine N-acetyltransferase